MYFRGSVLACWPVFSYQCPWGTSRWVSLFALHCPSAWTKCIALRRTH